MFMTYNAQTGAITGYSASEPQAGSWVIIPASAMQDPPLCYWDEAEMAFVDGDNGWRWNDVTGAFEPGLSQYQNTLYQKIRDGAAAALENIYPDFASTTFLQMMEVETRAFAAATNPNPADFPLIAQYATQRSLTFAAAADEVQGLALPSYAQRAAIFARRERGILEVVNATTLAEALAAASIDWESVVVNAPDSPAAWPAPMRTGVGGGGGGPVGWADVQNKPQSFPPATHGHGIGDVAGLVDALAGKQGAGSYETAGAAAAALTGHLADADPHPQYTTAAELAAALAGVTAAAKGVHAKEVLLTSGSYLSQAVNGTALTAAASAANRFYQIPFIPAQTITISELAFEVSTLLAGSAHIGLYADAAGAPGAKITGTSTALDTGTAGAKTAVLSATLTAGTVYWLVVWTSAAVTLRMVPQAALMVLGLSATLNKQYTCRLATSAFGALPASAPAGTLTAGAVPWVRLKIA